MTVDPPIRCQPVPELAAFLQIAMNRAQHAHVDQPATQDRIDALMCDFRAEIFKMADRQELAAFEVFEARDIESLSCEAEHVMTNAGARMRVWFDGIAGTPLEKYMRDESE